MNTQQLITCSLLWLALSGAGHAQPVISQQPTNQQVLSGGAVIFYIAVSNATAATYQWYFLNPSFQTPAGALAQTFNGFTVGAMVTNGGSGYTTVPAVRISGGGGGGASGFAMVSNGMVVAITMTSAGSNYASLPAVQIDPPNGQLGGATNTSLMLTAVTSNNAGSYIVVATNNSGSVTSSLATLTIVALGITQPPTNFVQTNGGAATFSVSAGGVGPFSYQWMFNGANIGSFITTVAGNGNTGFSGDGGAATSASMYFPAGVAVDGAGNVFIADYNNYRVRKVGTNGIITTVAGNGSTGFSGDGGPATNASIYNPTAVAVDSAGNLFIADRYNNRVRMVGTNGIITTVAGNGSTGFSGDGGAATNAGIYYPASLALDSAGNLFIADYYSYRVRKVDTNGVISTVAGNGSYGVSGDGGAATNAALSSPAGVVVDGLGNVFIADYNNNRIRQVGTNGIITTVAGSGSSGFSGDGNLAIRAGLYNPAGVALDSAGNLFVADYNNRRVRKVFAWPANLSSLSLAGITTNNLGNYAVIVSNSTGSITSSVAVLNMPAFVAAQPADQTALLGGTVTFGLTPGGSAPFNLQWAFNGTNLLGATNASYAVTGAALTNAGLYAATVTNSFGGATTRSATLTVAFINQPPTNQTIYAGGTTSFGVTMSTSSSTYTYQWQFNGTNLPASGIISTIAGNGSGSSSGDGGLATNAGLFYGNSVAVDGAGNVFIADYNNNRVRKVDTNGIITTVAGTGAYNFSGDGGLAVNATFRYAWGVAVDNAGNLFIADYNNYRVRKVGTNGIITTVAGTGSSGFSGDGGTATNAAISYPYGVAVDNAGNLFIADYNNNRVRKAGTNGIITTVAGTGSTGFSGDGGGAINAAIYNPTGVAVDNGGNLFIADYNNARVRKVNVNGIITTVAGNGTAGFSGDAGLATGASLYHPYGVSVDSAGNLFIGDYQNNRIREVGTNGIINTIAGTGINGFSGDGGRAANAKLSFPRAVMVDGTGNLYIGESYRVRKIVGNPAYSPLLATLILGNVATSNVGNYSVIIQNASGSITSAVASLTVTMLPVVTTQPASQTVIAGSNAVFSVAAGGASPFAYQWYYLNPAGQTPAGATAQTVLGFTVAATVTNGGNGYVTVPNVQFFGGGGTGAGGVATVSNGMVIAITITNAGSGYASAPTVQIDPPSQLSGQTGTVLSLNAVTPGNAGDYVVTVGNNYGSVTSQVAKLTVLPCVVTIQPTNRVVGVGRSASYAAVATGSGPFGYQWYFAGKNLLSSDTNSTLTLTGVSTNNTGDYTVVVTNAYGSVTSQVATLTVVLPPTIVTQPAGQTNLAGTSITFSVTAAGVGPFSYQWRINGTNIPNNIITTVAGVGVNGFGGDGGAATNASLDNPYGLAFDSAGNAYIADRYNSRIRKVSTNGIITTFAGNANSAYSGDGGTATNASLNNPYSVGFDGFGNLYITDTFNQRIRKVDTNGIITTAAGNASLSLPSEVIFDAAGNFYISDRGHSRILKVDTNGTITIVAGSGSGYSGDGGLATNASLSSPWGIAFDPAGNLHIADSGNNRIRKVSNGIITTVAGDGSTGYGGDGGAATNASLNGAWRLTFDSLGSLYISDRNNNRLRKVDTNGIITTVAGTGIGGYSGDGAAAPAANLHSAGVAVDPYGNLYIADNMSGVIREVHVAGLPIFGLTGVLASNAGNYSVVVTSPYGSVTSVVATLTVTIPTTPPQIIVNDGSFGFATSQSAFGFGFNIAGAFGQTIVVDGATNLVDWMPLFTNLLQGTAFYFFDPSTTNFPVRFYRAKLP